MKKPREFWLAEPNDCDLNEGNFSWYAIPEEWAREKHKKNYLHVREVLKDDDSYAFEAVEWRKMAQELADALEWLLIKDDNKVPMCQEIFNKFEKMKNE